MMPVTPLATPREIRDEALRKSLRLVEINLTGCCDKLSVMRRFSESLSLPPTFGFNWDALVDVLRELNATDDEHGLIVMVYGADALRKNSPRDHAILKDILEEWSAESDPNKVSAFILNTLHD